MGLHIKNWFQNQIREIESHRGWAYFGSLLCFIHVVTRFFWDPIFTQSRSLVPPICWSFFPRCDLLVFSSVTNRIVAEAYLSLAVVGIFLFASRKIRTGWWVLFALNIFKYVLLLGSFDRMGNYHYMPFVISFCFLFISRKDWLIPFMIGLFYFVAGTLKLNLEWLSGAALFNGQFVGDFWLQWLCALVVFLEMILVWGLFQRSAWLRWGVLSLLLCFHLYSAFIVGYFYPVIMMSLLAIFPLLWSRSQFFEWKFPGKTQMIFVVLFLCCQILPYLQKGDPALMGRGRVFALSMFDGNAQCTASLLLRFKQSTVEINPVERLGWSAPRTRCSPMVYTHLANLECQKNKLNPDFLEMDFLMASRLATDREFTPMISVTNFCGRQASFNLLLANDWMQ